jgi:CDP-paratose 2-epimerase
METKPAPGETITNFAGGVANSMSLRELHEWCESRFGAHAVQRETADRPFDLPWVVLDSSLAQKRFGWKPTTALPAILDEIAAHAKANPDWLTMTAA